MSRFCNVAISLLFSLALLGPTAVFACEKLHVELPSWATAEDAKWLSGGAKDGNVKASMSLEGFSSGELQDAIADAVGNRIPFKARAMLGNAAMQRACIEAANAAFGFDCYPTYFGSTRIYIPSADAVGYIPRREPDGQLASLRGLGEGAAAFAARHPGVDVVLVVVQSYRDPAVSPAYGLVAGCVTPAEQVAAVEAGASGPANVHLVSVGYDSLEDYYGDYFRTDHHWNHRGAERAFNAAAADLGLPAFESPGEAAIEGYRYSGATARWGLDLVEEDVSATSYDFSTLTVVSPDGSLALYGHDAFFSRTDPGKRHAFYDSYYDNVMSGSVVRGPGEGSAVLVSNSYGAGILPYVALSYSEALRLNALHPQGRDAADRLESIVQERGASAVFIVGDPTDLADFQAACPNYFDEA